MLLEGNGIPGIPHLVSFSLLGWVLWLEGIFFCPFSPTSPPSGCSFRKCASADLCWTPKTCSESVVRAGIMAQQVQKPLKMSKSLSDHLVSGPGSASHPASCCWAWEKQTLTQEFGSCQPCGRSGFSLLRPWGFRE